MSNFQIFWLHPNCVRKKRTMFDNNRMRARFFRDTVELRAWFLHDRAELHAHILFKENRFSPSWMCRPENHLSVFNIIAIFGYYH